MNVIAVDLDDTLVGCTETGVVGLPFIQKCNTMFENPDNFIVIYTARSYSIFHQTRQLLLDHGIKHHALVMEKIRATTYYDDRNEDIKCSQ